MHPGWVPMTGSPGLGTSLRWADVPVDGGINKGRIVKSLRISANEWREELYKRIYNKGEPGVPQWTISGPVGGDYKKEMAGESRVVRRGPRGQALIEWVQTGANHYWDCEVYQVALFEAVKAFIFDVAKEADRPSGPPPMPAGPLSNELEEVDRQRRMAQVGRDELGEITERFWT